jgi:hypothetical protein
MTIRHNKKDVIGHYKNYVGFSLIVCSENTSDDVAINDAAPMPVVFKNDLLVK